MMIRLENIFKTVSDVVEDLVEHDRAASDAKSEEPSIEERKVVSLMQWRIWQAGFLCSWTGQTSTRVPSLWWRMR